MPDAPTDARVDRVPPEVLFVVGAISLYVGSSLAVRAYDELDVVAVAWLRVLGAAITLCLWRRPWRSRWTRRRLLLVAAFGLVTTGMNTAFYLSIARIPVGTAVAIEFLGPTAVAAFGTRRRNDVGALGLVVLGVLAVSGARWDADAPGILWALCAAGLWAGYIVAGHRVADEGAGLDGLAVGLAIGAVALAPLGAPASGPAWSDLGLLGVTLSVGVLSNAIPYGLDQVVLRRIDRHRFALLLSILPVTATIVAAVVLGQVPTAVELVGISLVVVALVISGTAARRPVAPG